MGNKNSYWLWDLKMLNKVDIKKALTLAQTISINRSHGNLELLISQWYTKSYTFKMAWGNLDPLLRIVLHQQCCPCLETPTWCGVVRNEEDKEKLKLKNEYFSGSRSLGKGTYASWIHYFKTRKGGGGGEGGGNSSYQIEAMLSYWLSWVVLPNGLEDEVNSFVFLLAILFERGSSILVHYSSTRWVCGQYCLFVGRFNMVTHADTLLNVHMAKTLCCITKTAWIPHERAGIDSCP